MPRPQQRDITFTIDGREVTAPQNTMLVDAAKRGDVEIPVFCYEPKLGQPVGACRMCLVEIEGIPKLQTGCSTPVKDGMVVHTQTERVREAQEAVVEFLLINHPLDCPVCDKGGECPLQDISFGWGGGRSRFIEPKRHFVKPLELSPTIAIDRERCILCYRCVRFSQEVSEDYQLVLLERGTHSYVATFDGHPYVGPFSGNIIELCPVGALTSRPYRFRARPWDIEGAGSLCTLCPSQCNVTFTVRDDRVLRVLARQHDGVDDGWLCDKGRFAYQAIHVDERVTSPMLRDGGELRPVSWERALEEAAAGLKRAKGSVQALAGGDATNEEGFLLRRLLGEALGSEAVECRLGGGPPAEVAAALAHPSLQATVPDIEFAHSVLVLDTEPVDDMPILDLRIRKGVRRNKVRLAVASSRPSSLDANAQAVARFAPGAGEAFVAALSACFGGGGVVGELAEAAGTTEHEVRTIAGALRGQDIVIVWGERLTQGPRGAHAARALLNVAGRLGMADREGAGLLEIPAATNGRGLREVGCTSDAELLDKPGGGLSAAHRPAARRLRPPHVGAAAGERDHRRRPCGLPHRRRARARDRGVPGRVARREGRDGHAPRRPHPAAAPLDRAAGPDALRLARAGRAGRAAGRAGARADGRHGLAAGDRGRAVLLGHHARRARRARRALAGTQSRRRGPARPRPVRAGGPAPSRRGRTACCGWAPTARSGTAPRSPPRPHCASSPTPCTSSSRPTTPSA